MKVAAATGMKNPEGDGCAVEADFVWILRGVYPESFGCAQDQLRRRAQNDSLFSRISMWDTLILVWVNRPCSGSQSTPLKPKDGLNGPPG